MLSLGLKAIMLINMSIILLSNFQNFAYYILCSQILPIILKIMPNQNTSLQEIISCGFHFL